MNIKLPKEKNPVYFHVTSVGRTVIGMKKSEFVNEKIIKFEIKEIQEQKTFFDYELVSHNMQGSATIHSWISDIETLQDKLTLVTDQKGQLRDFYMFSNLLQKWENQYVPKLKNKYINNPGIDEMIAETTKTLKDKNLFLESFVGYSAWRLFFQDFYREHSAEETEELTLKGYFGEIDLPLNISKKAYKDVSGQSRIEREANLNKEKFNRKEFAKMLKSLTNIFNIDATLTVDMEEEYTFGDNGWCKEAEVFLQTSVENWYLVASAHQLKQISEEEAINLKTQFSAVQVPKQRRYNFLAE